MKNAGFFSLPSCEDTINEVKSLLDEHASGWGMKREEDTVNIRGWGEVNVSGPVEPGGTKHGAASLVVDRKAANGHKTKKNRRI
ncbi:hypothetical protein V6N11_081334 [Hibiscus sabdariffa]|uniref:Uncharacterized protein n=1 Tax=Hibiscus sabdariffa TaxID=183260 RepID=A0ABR2QJL4_9ROSI